VQGASENILSAETVESPRKMKVLHSVMTCSSESVSVTPSIGIEVSFCCGLFCVIMASVRYNLEHRVFIYDSYIKKLIQIV
jgi:hypothetical protein